MTIQIKLEVDAIFHREDEESIEEFKELFQEIFSVYDPKTETGLFQKVNHFKLSVEEVPISTGALHPSHFFRSK